MKNNNSISVSLIVLLVLASIVTTISACGGGSDNNASNFPTNIDNTRWLGSCDANGNNYTQIQIAFSANRIFIRNYKYFDENCKRLQLAGRRITTGSYKQGGLTSSGLYKIIDFTMPVTGDRSHIPYVPLEKNIYNIRNGLLYFGDVTSITKGRPVIVNALSCCTFADNNPSIVSQGKSRISFQTTASNKLYVESNNDKITKLEGDWRNFCWNKLKVNLRFTNNIINVRRTYFKDDNCIEVNKVDEAQGKFVIGSTIVMENGLDSNALVVYYEASDDDFSYLPVDTHFEVLNGILYLGDVNGINFDRAFYQ